MSWSEGTANPQIQKSLKNVIEQLQRTPMPEWLTITLAAPPNDERLVYVGNGNEHIWVHRDDEEKWRRQQMDNK